MMESAASVSAEEVERMSEVARQELQQGDIDRAIAMLEDITRRAPDSAITYVRLGITLRLRGDLIGSRNAFRRATEIQPDLAEAHHGLGSVISAMGDVREALPHLLRAGNTDPHNAAIQNDIGGALTALGFHLDAIAAFERAASLRPGWSVPLHNMAIATGRTGDRERARELMQRATETGSPHWLSHVEVGVQSLRDGNFRDGWRGYEWRGENGGKPVFRSDFVAPVWDGSPLGTRTLLLWYEQGYGDLLQFARFAALIPKDEGRVVLYAPASLAAVVATCPGIDRVVIDGDAVDIDLQFPLMSLPWLLDVVPTPIPPYLHAPAECPDAEKAIEPGAAFNVGVVWASGRLYPAHAARDCPLALFAPLAEIPGVRLFSLQHGDTGADLAGSPIPIVDLSSVLGDFYKTAAFVKRLDLIITVDTSLAHLAGALGAPVWTLICHDPDWRWMKDEDTTPWYATMRLYRQQKPGDWTPVMERIERDLRALAGDRFPSSSPPPAKPVVIVPKADPRMFIKQYGEPRTGTNYLRAAILANYADTEVLMHILGDKHGPPAPLEELRREAASSSDPALTFVSNATFGAPSAVTQPWIRDQVLEVRRVANAILNAFDRGDLRYLISIKDPYAWAVSIARYNRFILGTMALPDTFAERLAKECRRFNRVYTAWLALASAHPEDALVVRYEDILRDSEAVFSTIEKKFGLTRRSPHWNEIEGRVMPVHWDGWSVSISGEQFDRQYHLERRYLDRIPPHHRQIIAETIDWSLVAPFGYEPLRD